MIHATTSRGSPGPHEVAIVHDAPWEGAGSGYHSIIQDGNRYRLYYRASALGVENQRLKTGREVYCYAESRDGITFTKPELGLHDIDGFVSINFVERFSKPFTRIENPDYKTRSHFSSPP